MNIVKNRRPKRHLFNEKSGFLCLEYSFNSSVLSMFGLLVILNWFTTTELNYYYLYNSKEKITKEGLDNSNASIYPKGTLLIAMYGLEAVGTRGKCALLANKGTCNQACAAVIPSGSLSTDFLFYYYQSLGDKIMKYVGGTKRQNLNVGIIKKLKIPLPPFEEQKQIASILSKVDEQIQDNKKELNHLKELKKGLMQDLLTGKVRVSV